MNQPEEFGAAYRDCLRAHYAYVVREGDTKNELTLVPLLLKIGFSQEELDALYAELALELGLPPRGGIAEQAVPSAEPTMPEAAPLPAEQPTTEVVIAQAVPQAALQPEAPTTPQPSMSPTAPKIHRAEPPKAKPPKQMSLF